MSNYKTNEAFLCKDSSEPNELIHLNQRMIYVSMALRSVNDHKLLAITRGHIKGISTIMFLA